MKLSCVSFGGSVSYCWLSKSNGVQRMNEMSGSVRVTYIVACLFLHVSACRVQYVFAMCKMSLFPVYLQTVLTPPWIWIYQTQPPAAFDSPGSQEMTTEAQSHVSVHTLL